MSQCRRSGGGKMTLGVDKMMDTGMRWLRANASARETAQGDC